MSEKTNPQEQPVPSKEEIIKFLEEQVEVKTLQVQVQELNAKLATFRAEELKALSFIAQITNPQETKQQKHIITQEDIDANPELVEAGVSVGDEVMIPVQTEMPKQESSRKLKKETA